MNSINLAEFQKIFDFKQDNNLSGKPIFMYFFADWCGPCKMFSPIFEKVSEQYKDKVNFYKINSETEADLASMFMVRSIPTLVLIPLSGETMVMPGGLDENSLKYFIEGLISKK